MRCQICGRSRRVRFFDLAERTRFLNHSLHHSLTLCQGCADSVRAMAGESDGLYALADARFDVPAPPPGFFEVPYHELRSWEGTCGDSRKAPLPEGRGQAHR